jgi:hypothetical protein
VTECSTTAGLDGILAEVKAAMTREPIQLRFLRDKKADDLWDETESLLDQLVAAETEIDLVFGYIQEDTQRRSDRSRKILSRIENALSVLRRISPPPNDAIELLVAAANDIQAEQLRIRDGLTMLLRTLHPESGIGEKP